MLYEKAQNADSVCQNVTVAASARAHVWYDVHTPPLHQGCAGQGVRRVWFGEGCASQPGADPGNLVQPHRVRRAPAVPHSRVRVPRAVRTQDARPDVPHLPVEGVHPHERVLAPVLLAQGIQVRQGHAVHAVHRRMPGESGAKINRGAHSSPRGSTDAVSVWPPRCRGGSTCDDRPGRFNRDAAARFGDRQRTRTHRTHTRVHPVATPRATRHHPRRTPPRWYRTRVRFLPRFFHHERKFLHTFWPFVFPRFRTSRLPLTPTPPFHLSPPQGAPLWWASKHRRHHAHCDTKEDPHSPVAFGKLYAWMGWVYSRDGEGPFGSGHDQEYMQDHLKFPELALMENFYYVPVFAVHLVFYLTLGPAWAIYCSMMSGCLCMSLTLYFNVMFHDHPAPKTEAEKAKFANATGVCRAKDIPFDPLANTFGEAYHGWHHRYVSGLSQIPTQRYRPSRTVSCPWSSTLSLKGSALHTSHTHCFTSNAGDCLSLHRDAQYTHTQDGRG